MRRVGALLHLPADAVTGLDLGHPRTDGLDRARTLIPQDDRQRALEVAGALADVEVVDAGCLEAHPRLTLARLPERELLEAHDLGTAVLPYDDRLHVVCIRRVKRSS